MRCIHPTEKNQRTERQSTIKKIVPQPIVKEVIKEVIVKEPDPQKIQELEAQLKRSESHKIELLNALEHVAQTSDNERIKLNETLKKAMTESINRQELLIKQIQEREEEIKTLKASIGNRVEEIGQQIDQLAKSPRRSSTEEKPQKTVFERLYENKPPENSKKKDIKKQHAGKKL